MVGSGRIAAAALMAVAAQVVAVGCADEPLSGPSLVLTLASPDTANDQNGPWIQHFAEEVARRSEGTIRIVPEWDVTPPGSHGWDQTVARGVADGTWDLGMVPGRAWDELGVTSLRALDTPFLVTNNELLAALIESGLKERLLAGLTDAGVVALELFPGDLRHPFAFTTPLRSADDYRGQVVRAPTSATTRAFFEALGARVVDDEADPTTQRGMESAYVVTHAGTATGNLTFFPKTEVLAMGADVRDRLRPDQRAILDDAAAATQSWVLDRFPSDAEQAADFCARRGRIVAASASELGSFEPAAAEVRTMLEEDEETRSLIRAIEVLAESYPDPPPVTRCPDLERADQTGTDDSALNGVYEARVSLKAMLRAGVERSRALQNAAHYTWTLEDGTWHYLARAQHFIQNPEDSGRYTWDGRRFYFYWPDGWVQARLEIDRDGSIRFHEVMDQLPEIQAESEVFYSAPWRRVGDLDQ